MNKKILVKLVYLLFYLLFYGAFLFKESASPAILNSQAFYHSFFFAFALKTGASLVLLSQTSETVQPFSFKALAQSLLLTLALLAVGLALAALMPNGRANALAPRGWFWAAALLFCLAVGYEEELFFRALGRGVFKSQPSGLRIVLLCLLFALAHSNQSAQSFAAAAVLGLILAAVYEKKTDLHLNALAHAWYNAAALALL